MSERDDLTWFSHFGTEYQVRTVGNYKTVEFKHTQTIFDWDNCTIQIARSPLKKLRIFIRGHTNRYSHYNKKIVRPTFLLTIDVDSITPPVETDYQIGMERKDLKSLHHKPYRRYVFEMDNKYWIWEWKKNHDDIKQSKVYLIYGRIMEYLDKLSQKKVENPTLIVETFPHFDKDLIPAIYQPAIDQLKNFVREIHCSKTTNNGKLIFIEVSILFNNEELRRHKVLNRFYEKFRLFFYGRIIDIETFRIYVGNGELASRYFTFEGIYSGDYGIEEDNIHGDIKLSNPVERRISSYFADDFHPVVFINTSNHAMAEKDNNDTLWKWEYRPFDKKSAAVFGTKSRKEIDGQFIPPVARIIRWIIDNIRTHKSL